MCSAKVATPTWLPSNDWKTFKKRIHTYRCGDCIFFCKADASTYAENHIYQTVSSESTVVSSWSFMNVLLNNICSESLELCSNYQAFCVALQIASLKSSSSNALRIPFKLYMQTHFKKALFSLFFKSLVKLFLAHHFNCI